MYIVTEILPVIKFSHAEYLSQLIDNNWEQGEFGDTGGEIDILRSDDNSFIGLRLWPYEPLAIILENSRLLEPGALAACFFFGLNRTWKEEISDDRIFEYVSLWKSKGSRRGIVVSLDCLPENQIVGIVAMCPQFAN